MLSRLFLIRNSVFIYHVDIVEEGTIVDIQEVLSLAILKKINDTKYFVCPGIGDYSTYRRSIGFDPKVVVHLALPIDTIRHKECPRFVMKSMHQKSLLCSSCVSLKYYLRKQKKRHDSDEFEVNHEKHKKTSSSLPFDYLSPCSKKARVANMRKEINSLRIKCHRASKKLLRLELNDDQDQELVNAISSSEVGQCELDRVFSDAEELEQGRGYKLRSVWDEDTSEIASFNEDQLKNSKVKCRVFILLYRYRKKR